MPTQVGGAAPWGIMAVPGNRFLPNTTIVSVPLCSVRQPGVAIERVQYVPVALQPRTGAALAYSRLQVVLNPYTVFIMTALNSLSAQVAWTVIGTPDTTGARYTGGNTPLTSIAILTSYIP